MTEMPAHQSTFQAENRARPAAGITSARIPGKNREMATAGTHLDWARQVLMGYNVVALCVVGVAIVGTSVALLYRARARRSMSS